MMRSFSPRSFLLLLPLALAACDGLDNWANAHMPVIGERCEHWQCFTASGQEQSKINHEERLHQETAGATGENAAAPAGMPATPIPAGAPAVAPPPAAAAEPTPPEGAYKYVPRTAAPKGTTPFDGSIPPLE